MKGNKMYQQKLFEIRPGVWRYEFHSPNESLAYFIYVGWLDPGCIPL